MRHRKGFNHLGRTSSHRKAMLANMACSLIMHKRITTTVAKAKALRSYVEPLITRSKEDSTHARRLVFSYLQDKNAVSELFREVATRIGERPGGYTRILKTGNRIGDNADMCIIELVDYNEVMLGTDDTRQKSTRRRRGGKKKAEEVTAAAPVAEKGKPAEPDAEAEEAETVTEEPKAVAEEVEATPEVVEQDEEAPAVAETKAETKPVEEKEDGSENGEVNGEDQKKE